VLPRFVEARGENSQLVRGQLQAGGMAHEEVGSACNGPVGVHNCWACDGTTPGGGIGDRMAMAMEDLRVARRIVQALQNLTSPIAAACVIMVAFMASWDTAEAVSSGPDVGARGITTLLATCVGFSLFFGCIATSTAVQDASQDKSVSAADKVEYEPETYSDEKKQEIAEKVAQALRIQTVSQDEHAEVETDTDTFLKLHDLIYELFPLVHSNPNVIRTVVNKYSLCYEWKGEDQEADPVMLCAHLDVVPVTEPEKWEREPFSGDIDENGFVWGRGAVDNKHNVLMQLQAVEDLLASGIEQPPRTVYFAFGHDEEIGGYDGAREIGMLIREKLGPNKKLHFLLDEGVFVLKGLIPGMKEPVSVVGHCEKGNVSMQLTVDHHPPGHSSAPPAESNIGILSRAIDRIERHPFPMDIDGFMDSIQSIGNSLPLIIRVMYSNRWLFRPVIRMVVQKSPFLWSATRTTSAVTVTRAGSKMNILPGLAQAWVNHRIHPNTGSPAAVKAYLEKVINDPRVKVEEFGRWTLDPSPVAPTKGPIFELLRKVSKKVFNAPVMAAIMTGNTDTRWYWDLTDNIYRHTPIVFETIDDAKMFHGNNERVSKAQLASLLQFYTLLLQSK